VADPPAGHELTRRYEQLRDAAGSAGGDAWRHGLGVLATKGVAAWMAAWTALAVPAAAAAGTTTAAPSASAPTPDRGGQGASACAPSSLPARTTSEIVAVLAQMTLAHARNTPPRVEGRPP
jgi:hypothetical protein